MEQRIAFRVFLVEDSPMLRTRVEAMVGAIAGAQVIGHAEDADSAIEGILARRPDAVVLDIQLAKGSGLDVLRALRREAPEIQVYVLTNFATDAYRRAAERLGARGFFDKSNEFERLRESLAAAGLPPK